MYLFLPVSVHWTVVIRSIVIVSDYIENTQCNTSEIRLESSLSHQEN